MDWQAETIRHLQAGGDAVLAVVIAADGMARPLVDGQPFQDDSSPVAGAGGSMLARFAGRSLPTSIQATHEVPWPATVPVIKAGADGSSLAGLDRLAEYRLDVLLDLGPLEPARDTARFARYGTWRFVHGSGSSSWPVGTREIARGRPVITAELVAHHDGADPHRLREGWFQTAPESRGRTCDRVLLGSSRWPALVCREIRLTGQLPSGPGLPPSGRNPAPPTVRDAVAFGLATIGAIGRRLWHHGMRHDDWNIGVVDAPIATLRNESRPTEVHWAPVRRGHYAADPFGRWNGGELEVFYEDFLHARDAASIARRVWRRYGGWGAPGASLDVGSHLSYPFLIEHEGQRYILPESRSSGSLVLYREDGPGGDWVPHATLGVSGDVGDATAVRHDGRWWLFGVGSDRLNPATHLMVWYADQLEGPWTAHPLNPVVSDVRSARPGGPFFVQDGVLYRPAQDCSTGYGDRIAIKRVNVLTAERVDEEIVSWFGPQRDGPFPYGLHTLTEVGDVTLVDGKRRIWNASATLLRVRRRLLR
jgi:hypothetical protein